MPSTLLIVDDNAKDRRRLSEILSGEFQTLEAESCALAAELIRDRGGELSLVLLNTSMAGAEELASTMGRIVLAASVEEGNREAELRALDMGAEDLILRPYDARMVQRRVEGLMKLVEVKQDIDALRISQERYRIAASAGGRVTAYYDFKTGKYHCGDVHLTALGFDPVIDGMPQVFIDRGVIPPESVEAYLTFFESLKNGARMSSAKLAIRMDEQSVRWFSCTATLILDPAGRPVQAVIVYTDVTEEQEKEAVYIRWQQSLSQRPKESYTLFRCNLSQNCSFESMDGLLLQDHVRESALPFDEQTRIYAESFVHPEDRAEYISVVDADVLLANYYRNHRIQTLEYRELLPEEGSRWIRLVIELIEYPNSPDIAAYMMYEDIDDEKRQALHVKRLAETDPLTGVLNRKTFAEQVSLILDEESGASHAFIILDADHFKQLNDTLGHAGGDEALISIAGSLRSVLRRGDLLGRLGGDEFVIFMRNVPYDAVIEKKAGMICSLTRKVLQDDIQLSVSIGVAVYPRDGEDYDTLYRNADTALYDAKNAGKDRFFFYHPQMSGRIGVSDGVRAPEPGIIGGQPLRRILIVDDNRINREILSQIFADQFTVETANDGYTALARLKHFGQSIAVVLLDLVMPGMDGFTVLAKIRESAELRSIPVIVVSGKEEQDISLRAIRSGAADFVTKPVDPELIRVRVESAVGRAESERLRAQNSYLLLQSGEEQKYRTVLEATGTVVMELDWVNGVFTYDPSVTKYIFGRFDGRRLWQILLSDMVASTADVRAMQELVHEIATDKKRVSGSVTVRLKTASGKKQWFRMSVFKRISEFNITSKIILTFNNIDEEVLSSERLHYQAERDELTGLLNREAFFARAGELIASKHPGYYVMAAFDIDSFKVINDQYGSEKGDEVLRQVATAFTEGFAPAGGIASRITADNFAVLYPASFIQSPRLEQIRVDASELDGSIPPLSFSIGRYIVDDLSLPVSGMYDRATLAQNSVKGRYDVHIAQYDEAMRKELLNRQRMIEEMKDALEDGQFEPWFQPQYNHSTGARIGAEALVRWRHPERGIILPGDFVPAFERSGFIFELDRYIWDRVCRCLRKWLDEGRDPLPVSVNISRYDILHDDVCAIILGLLKKYRLPAALLRVEITESAFAKDSERIVSVVKEFIGHGFTVEIDDFGSGYSSLNTLKDVPAQVLKMDMRFLETTVCSIDGSCEESASRGGNILESVVRMAKWLGMSVIAEGVETREQADYLASIGCSYVQGYLYARPMSMEDYERLAMKGEKEEKLLALELVENYDNNRFWAPDSTDSLIFNAYVGGACIFEWSAGRAELLRANKKYARILGGEGFTVEQALRLDLPAHMDEVGLAAMKSALDSAVATGEDAVFEAVYHDLLGGGRDIYLRSTFRMIASASGRYLIYSAIENLSAQREAEQQRRAVQTQLQTIMANVDSGISAVTVDEAGAVSFVFANDTYYSMLGYTRELYEAEVEDVFRLLIPEDRGRIHEEVSRVLASGRNASYEYRCIKRDGQLIHIHCNASVTALPGIDRPVLLSVITDISARRQAEHQVRELNQSLQNMMDDMPGGFARLRVLPDGDLATEYVNENFCRLRGMSREEILSGDGENAMGTIHPDDKDRVRKVMEALLSDGGTAKMSYRLLHADGSYVPLTVSARLTRNEAGELMINAYYAEPELEEKRRLAVQDILPIALSTIMSSTSDLSFIKDMELRYLSCSRTFARMVGFDSEESIVGKTDYDIFDKATADAYRADDLRLLENGEPLIDYLEAIPSDDGLQHYSSTSKYILHDGAGTAIGLYGVGRDVTEVQSAFDRLKLLTDSIPGGLATYALTPEGLRIVYFNDGMCKLFGCTREEYSAATRNSVVTTVYPEDLPALQAQITRMMTDGTPVNCTYRISSMADGSRKWLNLRATPAEKRGGILQANAVFYDVTEQNQRYELERARPSMGEADLMVHALFDLNTGETLDYSYQDGAEVPQEERTAFSADGDRLEQIIIDDQERARYRELNDPARLLKLFDSGETEFSIDYRRRTPGGEVIWARNLLRTVRQPGGSDVLLFEYCYNIEKEKTWELLYATLLQDNYDYVSRIDCASGRYELLSYRADGQGLPPVKGEDLSAASESWVPQNVHPDDVAAMLEATTIQGARKKLRDTDRYQVTFRQLLPGGELRYKKLSVYMLDRKREIIIATREDVSELVRGELSKNAQLADALAAANQASRAKSQFLSRMSHELRTPMNAIIGLTALSASEVNDPKAMTDAIGKIGMSARYLLSLINDILEMSRIESGRMSLNEAPFDFERLIGEVNTVINAQTEEKGLDYDVTVNGYTEPFYVGDAVKLQQILVNILGNAVKFTPRGGKVTMNIEQLRRTKKGVSLRFTVTDTGVGIDEQFLPHIFDLFEQETSAPSATSIGTGLGLPISKSLAEMMNGKIDVKSIKGVGSVFTVIVQLGITQESQRYLDMAASMQLNKLRTLVVDDDITVCRSTQDILKKLGMQAEWVDSGIKAVDRVKEVHAQEQDFDTVIIDWKMPDIDGVETARRIRALVGPELTIIIMTAFDWHSIEAEAREAGVDLFMDKPLFQSSIVRAFEQVFLRHRIEKQEPAEPLPPPDFTGRRILLAEDNPLNQEITRRMLESVGAQVVAVGNGLEAMETFTTEPPGYFDAILMDIRMPVMDGLTATKSIRRLKKEGSRSVPIIATTANAFDEDVELSIASGMNAHLAKPIEPELLFATLKRLMG